MMAWRISLVKGGRAPRWFTDLGQWSVDAKHARKFHERPEAEQFQKTLQKHADGARGGGVYSVVGE